MRLVDLQANQELTLQGCWSSKNLNVFLASNFYLEETKEENSFCWLENDEFIDWKIGQKGVVFHFISL